MRELWRLGDLLRDRKRLIQGNRPLGNAVSQDRPLNQLQDERPGVVALFDAVDGGDFGWFRLARTCASRWNRARRSGSAAKASGRIFSATWRLSWVSVACQTWPMPPSPMRAVTS